MVGRAALGLMLLAAPVAAAAQESSTRSITERIVFTTPVVTVTRIDTFSTRIIGRLQGGSVFDRTFDVAIDDPSAQAGLGDARLAITTLGGPGVIIAEPVRTLRTETLQSSESSSQFSLNRTESSFIFSTTIGPGTQLAGGYYSTNGGPCEAAVAALPSPTRPVCGPDTRANVTVVAGESNLDINQDNVHYDDEARDQTDAWLIFEQWEIEGSVVAIGTVHAAIQSGLFDQAGRLLRRLPEQGAGGWGEAYAMQVRHGDRRDTAGLAGGFGFEAAPGLTLGVAADQGWIDVDVPGAQESGDLDLTEIGAVARLERGQFSAAVSGIYGFGSADTLRTIVGTSAASYDVRLTGAALDLSFALETGGWRIAPVAGLEYVRIESDAFAESDTLGLVAPAHDAERLRGSAGVEFGGELGIVEFAASARYVAVLDGEERKLPVAFAIAPDTPLLMTGPDEPDSVLLGARAHVRVAPGVALTFGYDGRFGEGYDGHAGFVGVRAAW